MRCREIVIVTIDGLEDTVFSASQSIQELTLYASTCWSLVTSNIGKSTGRRETYATKCFFHYPTLSLLFGFYKLGSTGIQPTKLGYVDKLLAQIEAL